MAQDVGVHGAEHRAAGRLAGDALGGLVSVAAAAHRAVSRRVTGFLPPGAAHIAGLQDAVAAAVYGVVEAGHRLVPAVGAEFWALADPGGGPPSSTPAGRFASAVVNGMFGSHLEDRYPALAVRTAVRTDHADLPLDAPNIAAAFPAAAPRIAVFLHGLAESEEQWWRRPDGGGPLHGPAAVRSYGDRLAEDAGFTAVYLRYNSGLPVRESGLAVSGLLEDLLPAWPVEVEEVSFVGHSMGGLVALAACHHAHRTEAAWTGRVRAVVTLGTPHTGAPLAKAVHGLERILSLLPETAPLGHVLASRSTGVKDLGSGGDLPFPFHVRHRHVAASITREVGHPAGHLIGDGLVRHHSATGRGRRPATDPGEPDHGLHLGGLHHFSLLNHPEIYARLLDWLTTPEDGPPSP